MHGPNEVFLEDVTRNHRQFRVLMVDHAIHEDTSVRHLLSSDPDFNVLAETHGSEYWWASLRKYKPHLVLLDISLMGDSGICLLQQLRADSKFKPVLVLADVEDPVYALQLLRERANGYVVKREAPDCLVTAMKRVMLGQVYMNESVRKAIVAHVDREVQRDPGVGGLMHCLRSEVAVYCRYGLAPVQISKFLKLPMPQLMVLLEELEKYSVRPKAAPDAVSKSIPDPAGSIRTESG